MGSWIKSYISREGIPVGIKYVPDEDYCFRSKLKTFKDERYVVHASNVYLLEKSPSDITLSVYAWLDGAYARFVLQSAANDLTLSKNGVDLSVREYKRYPDAINTMINLLQIFKRKSTGGLSGVIDLTVKQLRKLARKSLIA